MKELSIEEKAKRYDKALEKARQLCAYPTSKPFISDLQDLFPELVESKPVEWSEKDKKMFEKVIANIECPPCTTANYKPIREMVDWLKSLKEKYTWKPSDEQLNALDSALRYSQVSHNSFKPLNSLFNDLKKLRGNKL